MDRKLDESEYKVDFMISEKYINFSGELLRLSLLAITGLGTVLIKIITVDSDMNQLEDPLPTAGSAYFIMSTICFVLCSVSALFHRYLATDTMSWYVGWLRAEQNNNEEKAKKEKAGFYKKLNLSRNSLIVCGITFGLGIVLFVIGIVSFFA